MIKKPRGRPPAACNTFSPSSKRCFDRVNHPYVPYRCDCVEKPLKAKRPLRYVSNPLFTSKIVKKPRGRQPSALNWSQNGMPNQIVNMRKKLDRERETLYIKKALAQRKEVLSRNLPSNQRNLRTHHAGLMKRFNKLMSVNPKKMSSFNKLSTRFVKMGNNIENAIATLNAPKNSNIVTKPKRKDPSINSALGAYWKPRNNKRVPKLRLV